MKFFERMIAQPDSDRGKRMKDKFVEWARWVYEEYQVAYANHWTETNGPHFKWKNIWNYIWDATSFDIFKVLIGAKELRH